MLSTAAVGAWQLWYADASQAVPALLTIQVSSFLIAIPTGHVGPETHAAAVHASLATVDADVVAQAFALFALLPGPKHAAADAEVASGQRIAPALVVQVAHGAKRLLLGRRPVSLLHLLVISFGFLANKSKHKKRWVKGCCQLGDPGSIKTSASQKLSQGGEVWQGLQAGKSGSTHLAKASFISFPPLAKV